jgi:hypothetical protein
MNVNLFIKMRSGSTATGGFETKSSTDAEKALGQGS